MFSGVVMSGKGVTCPTVFGAAFACVNGTCVNGTPSSGAILNESTERPICARSQS